MAASSINDQDGEASDIGLRGSHVERQTARPVERLRDVLGAGQRPGKQAERQARRRLRPRARGRTFASARRFRSASPR